MLFANFLVAITFGLGAPIVGAACGLAALMHFVLHVHHLCRAVELGDVLSEDSDDFSNRPALWDCYLVPRRCILVLVVTALLFWANGSLGYLHVLGVGGGALVALAVTIAFALALRRWLRWRARRQNIERRKTTGDVILEPLLRDGALVIE